MEKQMLCNNLSVDTGVITVWLYQINYLAVYFVNTRSVSSHAQY